MTGGETGRPRPRRDAPRLVAAYGHLVDDIVPPRMMHRAFARSPHAHAHAHIVDFDTVAAAMPEVGRAGTTPAVILLGVNDALSPVGAFLDRLPITRVGVLAALAPTRRAPAPAR